MSHALADVPAALFAASSADLPWVPLSAGRSFKPLRFLRGDRGFVELLRLAPGAGISLHRHTGEAHVYTLEGHRRLGSGELVGPGDFVHEAAGTVDSWHAEGEAPVVVLVIAMGAVEYVDAAGEVCARYTATSLWEMYVRQCEAEGGAVLDLWS
jgi:quercetin dioxygenase-like cupin family protein